MRDRKHRTDDPAAWQFRWSESGPEGKRLNDKKMARAVEHYHDENAAQARRSRASLRNQRRRPIGKFATLLWGVQEMAGVPLQGRQRRLKMPVTTHGECMKIAAFGVRMHSGWGALVCMSGDPATPEVVDRRRMVIIDSMMLGAKQPYHFAENLGLEEAERHLQRCAAVSHRLALQAIHEMLGGVTARKYRVLGCAMLLASGRALPSLQKILASHALIHTAEGEFFRNVVCDACEAFHIPVMRVRERELNERANTTFGNRAGSVRQHISELGKVVGSPWTQDEKTAALAALILSETGAGFTPLH